MRGGWDCVMVVAAVMLTGSAVVVNDGEGNGVEEESSLDFWGSLQLLYLSEG